MDIKRIAKGLSKLERAVLPLLPDYKDIQGISKASGLKEVEISRALQWLENKKLANIAENQKKRIDLDKNGKTYLKNGLPERKLLETLSKGPLTMDQVSKKSDLTKEEQSIALGMLRKKAAAFITKEGKDIVVKILPQGEKLLKDGLPEETFLEKEFPLYESDLKSEDVKIYKDLKKRKEILKVAPEKYVTATLTELGQELTSSDIEISDTFDTLTPDLLKTGRWREKEFRRYDVEIKVPKIAPAKKQPYKLFLDNLRTKFLSLGFEEMTGPLVESDFWDMDTLFMPQFHSARGIHDAFYIKDPKYTKIDQTILKKVKAVHETGANTGSKGWQYKFDEQKAQMNVMRTQTTACSARKLVSKDLNVPGKYFSIGRCFRPDVIDATHAADFNQVEGIIVEPNLTFRHLKGLLKLFAEEFCGTDQYKIVPAYFPFTEPSAELHAKHPELGWIELAGSGIFRSEVVKPLLGKDTTVLAWGIGIDRIAMFNLGIKDIRQLFSQDLDWIKKAGIQ